MAVIERYLVAYASGSGSTAEVARAIGNALVPEEIPVDILPAAEVDDLTPYSGVVLGSSIRLGRWLPDAVAFIKQHHEALIAVPVAYFTTCMTLIDDNIENRQTVLNYMSPLLQMAPDINPVALGLFAGSLHPNLGKLMSETQVYGDYRDWEGIREWATAVGEELRRGAAAVGGPVLMGGSVLRKGKLSSLDLRHIDLQETILKGKDLSGISLPDAQLEKASLSGTVLADADLPSAALGWAELQEADLRRANLYNANLIGANCAGADLRDADLTFAVLNGANLSKSDLSGADLSGADLNWADLQGADCHDTLFRKANVCWANLSGCNLTGADLDGLIYNNQTKWPAGFTPPAESIYIKGPG